MNSALPKKIVLISAPWQLFNRPSIQLGTLKAYLKSQFPELKPGLETDTHHIYLKIAEAIGYERYQAISERTWLAESVYAALLFPERLEQIEKLFYQEAVGKRLLRETVFKSLVRQVRDVSDAFISGINFENTILAGFSICFCQLTASLYFIRQIKKKFPNLNVVAGGSGIAAKSAGNLLQAFPEIDAIITGEGEHPLTQLVHYLTKSESLENIPYIPGIITRSARFSCTDKSVKTESDSPFSQLKNLDPLPSPDYDDYFHLLNTFNPQKTFFPVLPVEMSRGCWWRREVRNEEVRKEKWEKRNEDTSHFSPLTSHSTGCAFCNLNLQWEGYRAKKTAQVVSEIDHLTSKHKTLAVTFTDNVIPVRTSESVFNELAGLKKDFRLFCEIRASVSKKILKAMKTAGMYEVQIGIEGLSSRLLRKLNKGTTAIQNLEIMKNCEMFGIKNVSNLILYFPGSDEQDVAETLRILEFALPFRPLRSVPFWLGLESPVWQNPRDFGIKAVFNHPNYNVLFPPDIARSVSFTIQAYRGDRMYQKKLWQPVKKKITAWEKQYAELHKGISKEPILYFRDGREFLIIWQRRIHGKPYTHRLVGTSRAIYLFCQKHRSVKRILKQFPQITEDKLIPFLKMMRDKKLMFEENNQYLSLAVPEKQSEQSNHF